MPENTERDPHPEWVMGGNPDAIVEQEKEGQRQLVEDFQLPVRMVDCTEEDLEKMGIVLGEEIESDPLFRKVELPKGWTVRATEHQMWSDVFDEQGVVRLRVFYKAAFYDRRAHVMLG